MIIIFGWETAGMKVVFIGTVSFPRWIHQILMVMVMVMVMVGHKPHSAKMVIH